MSRVTVPIVVAIAALFLVACTAGASPSQAEAGTSGGAPGEGESVDVALTEFEIDMPASIAAGHVTFNVTNDGTTTHAFEVEGNGIEEVIEELEAGASGTLEVDLEPGTYEVYCPVGDHRGMGMELELEVTGS